jgi:hypothetical protein
MHAHSEGRGSPSVGLFVLFVCLVGENESGVGHMGRPSEVSDEDIIAAGRELAQRSAVTATGLWLSCGKRGRPARLLGV